MITLLLDNAVLILALVISVLTLLLALYACKRVKAISDALVESNKPVDQKERRGAAVLPPEENSADDLRETEDMRKAREQIAAMESALLDVIGYSSVTVSRRRKGRDE